MNEQIHARSARESVCNNAGLAKLCFLRTTAELLREVIHSDKEELKQMRQELSLLEPGRLYIHHRKGCFYFGRKETAKKETGITNDSACIHALARRAYLESRIGMIQQTVSRFEELLDELETINKRFYLDARLDRFSAAGLELTRILFSKEQNEWIDEIYTPNPYHKENLIYPTTNGLLTRSNSEAKIGSKFELIGLPYRFDDLVEIKSDRYDASPFRETYFADFKVPNLYGGITIHEHFGAFQIDQYSDNALKRLNDYHNFKVYELPGRPVKHNEFTWSFESDLHDVQLFQRMIRRMLIPGYPL